MWKLLVLGAVAYIVAATLACGRDDEQPSSTSAPAAVLTGAASSSTTPSEDPAEAALAAGLALVDGVPEADCSTNTRTRRTASRWTRTTVNWLHAASTSMV